MESKAKDAERGNWNEISAPPGYRLTTIKLFIHNHNFVGLVMDESARTAQTELTGNGMRKRVTGLT